jgi:DNA-binding NarL/FixJ family response regulator
MATVVLIDYPLAVRRALRARLSLEPDVDIVGEADDAAQGLSLAQVLDPSIVVLDAETPDLDAPAVVRSLVDQDPTRAVIVLSQHTAAMRQTLTGTPAVVVGKHQGLTGLVGAIRGAIAVRSA